jgi:hypothetical protein
MLGTGILKETGNWDVDSITVLPVANFFSVPIIAPVR